MKTSLEKRHNFMLSLIKFNKCLWFIHHGLFITFKKEVMFCGLTCIFKVYFCWSIFVLMITPIQIIYLFGVLRRFQHSTGHITSGSWKGRGNQYIQFVRVLYYKLPTNGKQLPAFPLEAMPGIEPQPQRWEARVLPLCHRGPSNTNKGILILERVGHNCL